MLPKRTQAMLVLWWLKQKNDEEEETLWERDESLDNIESTEQRLLNFYNTYIKLRTKPAHKAKTVAEHQTRQSPKNWNSSNHSQAEVFRDLYGIPLEGELNDLTKERLLAQIQERLNSLNKSLEEYKTFTPNSLKQALLNIVQGNQDLTDYNQEQQQILKKYLPVTYNTVEGTRYKSVRQRNAHERSKWYKNLNTTINNYRQQGYALRAMLYKTSTLRDFLNTWENSVEAIKQKVRNEAEYRTNYTSDEVTDLYRALSE